MKLLLLFVAVGGLGNGLCYADQKNCEKWVSNEVQAMHLGKDMDHPSSCTNKSSKAGQVRFEAATGTKVVWYRGELNYLYVEQPDVIGGRVDSKVLNFDDGCNLKKVEVSGPNGAMIEVNATRCEEVKRNRAEYMRRRPGETTPVPPAPSFIPAGFLAKAWTICETYGTSMPSSTAQVAGGESNSKDVSSGAAK